MPRPATDQPYTHFHTPLLALTHKTAKQWQFPSHPSYRLMLRQSSSSKNFNRLRQCCRQWAFALCLNIAANHLPFSPQNAPITINVAVYGSKTNDTRFLLSSPCNSQQNLLTQFYFTFLIPREVKRPTTACTVQRPTI